MYNEKYVENVLLLVIVVSVDVNNSNFLPGAIDAS